MGVRDQQLIDVNKLIRDLKGIKDMLVSAGDRFLASVINRSIGCAESQPVVDAVEVVHWHFENITGGMVMLGDCSECNVRQPVI